MANSANVYVQHHQINHFWFMVVAHSHPLLLNLLSIFQMDLKKVSNSINEGSLLHMVTQMTTREYERSPWISTRWTNLTFSLPTKSLHMTSLYLWMLGRRNFRQNKRDIQVLLLQTLQKETSFAIPNFCWSSGSCIWFRIRALDFAFDNTDVLSCVNMYSFC